jgi:hypothetical protein
MKTLTLEDFIKEEKHYDDAKNFLPEEQVIPVFNVRAMMERYASYMFNEGEKAGFTKGAIAQRVICAKAWDDCHDADKDSSSILNAPIASFKTEK